MAFEHADATIPMLAAAMKTKKQCFKDISVNSSR
jgi:hypothetical protein